MPGLGRFSRGKPGQTAFGNPEEVPPINTGATPEALPEEEEEERNWMQFDVSGMDFDNFGGSNEDVTTASSFGYHDEEEEQQVLPPPANAGLNQAPATNRRGLSIFKSKADNLSIAPESTTTATTATTTTATTASTTTTTTTAASTTPTNAGDTAMQESVSAAAADLQDTVSVDGYIEHQDAIMTESNSDSSILIMPHPATGRDSNASNPSDGTGLSIFGGNAANHGNENNSARTGISLLADASIDMNNVNHNANMNASVNGGNEKTFARTVPNFTPRAVAGGATQVVPPPIRASTALPASSSPTRVLPLPVKKMAPAAPPAAPSVPASTPQQQQQQQQQSRQGIIPRFVNHRIPQATQQKSRMVREHNVAKSPHQTTQMPRRTTLQTPKTIIPGNNSRSSSNRNRNQMNINPGLLKHAPPPVTPSPTSNNRPKQPMGGMTTTVFPPPHSKSRTSPHSNQRRDDTIVPPPASVPATNTQTATDGSPNTPPDDSSSTPDFNDLHAQFLSDIRDLEDTQNANGDRLLSMESNLSIAYSVLLQDQFQFLHLLDKLEHFTQETDQAIAKYHQSI
ncbi:MAG: hypothetical protein SGBAC_010914 [Bacillariaceae sp.]